MSELKPRPSSVTRRGAVIGLVLVLLLAGSIAVLSFRTTRTPAVTVTFLRFDVAMDGAPVAVLQIRNRSHHNLLLRTVDGFNTVLGRVTPRHAAPSKVIEISYPSPPGAALPGTLLLKSGSELTDRVRLPLDGRVGKVSVLAHKALYQAPGWLRPLQLRWRRWFPPHNPVMWFECDQEIRCPRQQPGGSTEPSALASPTDPPEAGLPAVEILDDRRP